MSTVLARMIKRTREPLSSVQPLAPAPFGAASADLASISTTAEPPAREDDDRAADPITAPRRAPARAPRGRDPDPSAAEDPDSTAPPRRMAPAAQTAPPGTAQTAPPGTAETAPLGAAATAPAESGTSAQAAEGVRHAPAEQDHPPDNSEPNRAPQGIEQRIEQRSEQRIEYDAARELDEPGAPPEIGTRSEEAAKLEPRATLVLSSRPEPAASAEPRTPPQPETADPRPEVTISIGHIEVRAAPVSAPPRASAPFRPRISLDQFLGEKQRGRQ